MCELVDLRKFPHYQLFPSKINFSDDSILLGSAENAALDAKEALSQIDVETRVAQLLYILR